MTAAAWRVPSKQNLADAPTRPAAKRAELRHLLDAGFQEAEWRWPRHVPWER